MGKTSQSDSKKAKRFMLKILIELAIIIVGWALVVSFFAFYTSIRPKKIIGSVTPESFGYQYQAVSFKTEDGLNLKGWFVPSKTSPAGTIIVLHGYPAEKGDVLTWALFLHDRYNLLFFDFRYFGESEGSYTTIGWKEQKDLQAAVSYLKTRSDVDPQKIGVMGFSLGGAVAIMGAGNIPEVKAVVADSPYATLDDLADMLFRRFSILKKPLIWSAKQWSKLFLKFDFSQVSPLAAARNSATPLLLIHGDQDRQIPLEQSKKIFEAAKGPVELWQVNGADHGGAYFQNKEIYESKVLGFFEKYL
ncbi:MAG: hypothetical protein COY66_06165 [Candidatus Kerfeldbacteria bacterium CG_4_10_14_0_8_um_filter_42_10]|uniref:Peptidase S9 prolyl oligopeptidase catalytic domain-containing protein n=1 Tax=Candidatus Kerfeldbacteria bacterium CG_4_10_14_0_8_um_filter_42_10 TaxID=2014248 RepID=A0A2M7RG70_9BACT|nr:MAG: hypothetical protein COY66_06165 [Candidatus Kerfeldbacteria bacterium CG_4_10_14_0_8_um_filter_42_10]